MKITPANLGLSLVFSVLVLNACSNDYTVEDTAQIFCNYTKAGRDDIPPQRLTTQLMADIDAAKETNYKFMDAAPTEKPPLGNGIQFQAAPDTASLCEVRNITKTKDGATAEIRHIFPEQPEYSWSDYLLLKKENGQWKIDNVIYNSLQSKNDLRSNLNTIAALTPE